MGFGFPVHVIKYTIRIKDVEIAPDADIRRALVSFTRTHEARQKKMYGISVVITEMVAS
jgi:hypothetical protein